MGKCFSKNVVKDETKSIEISEQYSQINESEIIKLREENAKLKEELALLKSEKKVNKSDKKTSNYKGETKILQMCEEFKRNNLIENYESNKKYEFCKHIQMLPFDICLYLKNCNIHIIIEVDGGQHFEDVKAWGTSYIIQQRKDVYKMKQLLKNNYYVIRVCSKDIFDNYEKIKLTLTVLINRVIKKIKNGKYKASCKYVASNLSIYDNHKKLMNEPEEDVRELYKK